jgi:hypothetical protein
MPKEKFMPQQVKTIMNEAMTIIVAFLDIINSEGSFA